MIDITVEHAALTPTPDGTGQWILAVQLTRDGKVERGLHVMPADALEWRMAEFNVNAKQAAEIVLTERIGNIPNPTQAVQPTRSEARKAKLDRVKQVLDGGKVTWAKGKPAFLAVREGVETIADSGDGDPLVTFIEASEISEDLIAVKREFLDAKRDGVRRRQQQRDAAKAEAEAAKGKDRGAGGRRLQRPSADQLRDRLLDSKRPRQKPEPSGPADTRRKEKPWRQ